MAENQNLPEGFLVNVSNFKKTGIVRDNVILRLIRVTIFAVDNR